LRINKQEKLIVIENCCEQRVLERGEPVVVIDRGQMMLIEVLGKAE